jgi:tRNA(Ile)-lysidine synthase
VSLYDCNVLEQISKNIRDRNLFRHDEQILVAVSGGVDSVALLHALHELGCRFTVAHFNHSLRGRESDADQKFVQQIAERLGLKIITDSADVKAHAKKSGQSIEMAARELRHRFLAKTARAQKIKTIALAHHAGDQVELFFLRLLRGTSAEGLGGMKWRSPSPQDKQIQLVRPLLNISRHDIERYAREHNLGWREDTSNKSRDFLRNRVRNELVPLLERDYQPALRKIVLRTMEVLADESELISELTKRRGTFEKLPVAIQRRLLQQQLFELGLTADFETIETLRTERGKVIEINPTTHIRCDRHGKLERLTAAANSAFGEKKRKVNIGLANEVSFSGCDLVFSLIKKTGTKFSAQPQTEIFDADKVGTVITLRHWQRGDRFHPIGAKSARKLQDIFVDLKIPRAERHTRVVATTKTGEIFWVEGVRISDRFKLTSETKRRLKLQWRRSS